MNKQKVIIWTTGIDNLFEGKGLVGGLAVQMMLWALTFKKEKWEVFTFTNHKIKHNANIEGIQFVYQKKINVLNIIFDQLISIYNIVKYKPSLIIHRGASRDLFILSLVSKIFEIKLIQMLASDSDVKLSEVLIKRSWDKKLYEIGLNNVSFFIAQNNLQKEILAKRFQKAKTIIIPNIWLNSNTLKDKKQGMLWVSNFRSLKRPTWFLDLAKRMPNVQFIMVGGPIDQELYNKCKEEAKNISNLNFKGPLSLNETNKLFEQCKMFVCTSEIEGFPNTFLQAFSNQVPIITTFDPSDLIKNYQLGVPVKNINELVEAICKLNDYALYKSIQNNIFEYFEQNHYPQKQYNKIVEIMNLV